jgi:hypothetical protein
MKWVAALFCKAETFVLAFSAVFIPVFNSTRFSVQSSRTEQLTGVPGAVVVTAPAQLMVAVALGGIC